MRRFFSGIIFLALFVVAGVVLTIGAQPRSQTAPDPEATPASAEEERERKIMERFLSVLEKNPRRGTALDRVYGYHVERGSLDKLVGDITARTQKNPKDGLGWMMLGLIESQRGRDAAAVSAFRQAEATLLQEPMASYYLGQSLVLVGQPDNAAEAFERAIARKPNPTDVLEIFQALGRVHQRAQRPDQALAVWNRLEKLFPDDLRVQEQIATTLAEEGQHEQALTRYELLAKNSKDRYRQSLFRMEVAELKVRVGKTQAALTDFEALYGQLNPDSWLYREIRRKIEEVFMRNDDLAGLAKYYESWIAKNPEDVDAMARLARNLASQGRVPEAQTWLSKALKLAPSRKELRLAFIEQLVMDQKFDKAIEQFEALNKADPNNPDYLRDWGRMILRDKSRPEAERKPAAVAVWRKLVEARPKDPVVVTQVADLLRQSELTDEALELYKKAVELAPNAPQYREYLGEYYHTLKRSHEALDTWRQIAEGANRNAKNLARLSEVFAGFGYVKEAVEAIAEACKLEADDFNLRLKHAELLYQTEKYPEALKELEIAARLSANAEEAEAVLAEQIKNYQSSDTLTVQIEDLQKQLKTGNAATGDRWHRLARFHEAARQLPEATVAIQNALTLDKQSIRAWSTAARIHEAGGNFLEAAEANRKLAAIDRRYRTEYLTNVAKLEAKLGRKEPALQAGRDLLAAAPGYSEHYQFFASLCFQLGENDLGLDTLRRSVRVNSEDSKGMMALANALTEQYRTDEAIELLWRTFEKSKDLEAKLGVVSRLTELYLQNNQFDRLLERLDRERREDGKQREMTICLAQAYQAAGDHGTARQQLERLLTENARDSQLLQQLSSLAEAEGDLTTATKYQQQLARVSPGKETDTRLAQLLSKSGEAEEAGQIWVRLATSEPEPHRVIKSVDNLLASSRFDTSLAVTEKILRDQPNNWEALYREGVAYASLEKPEEATRRFQAVLASNLLDDEQSVLVKERKKGQKPGRLAGSLVGQTTAHQTSPLENRMQNIWELRAATGLDSRDYYGSQQRGFWAPTDYGQARMASLTWLFTLATKQNKQIAFLKTLQEAQKKPGQQVRALWDWYYLQNVRQEQHEAYEAAKELAKSPDPTSSWLYLSSISGRAAKTGPRVRFNSEEPNAVENLPALPSDELEHVLLCYRTLKQRRPDWLNAVILANVATELKRAKRTDEEDKLYKEAVDSANQIEAVVSVMGLSATRGDVDGLLKLFDKADQMLGARGNSGTNSIQELANNLGQAMKVRSDAKATADILRLWDHYLASAIKRKKAAPPSRTGTQNYNNPYGNQNYYQIWSGQYNRSIQFDYPTPNEYYDYAAIQLLRNAFEFYRKDDLVSDMFKHLRTQLEKAPEGDRIFHHLGLAYLHWWSDDKEQAIEELGRAIKAAPNDTNLQFELAQIRERRGEPDEALALIDQINPLDHATMQRRETFALRLAVVTGDIERARQAAERMFGLRLDAETQVQLAAQMKQLGMHETAEAVLARAGRQAGNRTAAQVSLMMQYQAQNKTEVALQIAYQLLRRGPSQNFSPRGGGDNNGRDAAIQVLARSGKLEELIKRTEAQLKNSPKSLQLNLTLADYFRAAGDRTKTREIYENLANLRPDDAKLRYQIAQHLIEAGERESALTHFTAALKKEPSLYANNYWEIQRYYQEANKLDELLDVFESVDLKSVGNYWMVIEAVRSLMEDTKVRDKGLKLFRKAWEAFPNERAELLGRMYNDDIWKLPEMYEYARQAVIPSATETQIDNWNAISQIMSWNGDGKVTGVVTRLLDAGSRQNKLDALGKDVDQAMQKFPEWSGGKALQALLLAKRGQVDPAKKLMQEILDDKKNPMPLQARYIVGQELENYAALQDLAMKVYEGGLKEVDAEGGMDFSYNPIKRLIVLYQRTGRIEEAREIVLKFTKDRGNPGYDADYEAYRYINNMNAIASQLLELGYPVDAVRLFNDVLSDQERLQTASRWNGEYMKRQAQDGLSQALQGIKPETLPSAMRELLKQKTGVKTASTVVDMAVLVQPRDLPKATITSMLATTLKKVATNKELRPEMATTVADLLKKHPDDISILVTAALVAINDKKPQAIAETVELLVKSIAKTPLEELPAGTRANARQREQAMSQIAVWLVAKECFKHESLQASGDLLAARALEAARRQQDNIFALAILREWGQLALDKGDRATAETRWGQMLEIVVTNPQSKKEATKTSAAPIQSAPIAVADNQTAIAVSDDTPTNKSTPPTKAKSAPAKHQVLPVITLDRFNQAIEIAKLAARNNMHALSIKAVRESLAAGPPVQPIPQNDQSGRMAIASSPGGMAIIDGSANQNTLQQVEQKLVEIDVEWRRWKTPAIDVYEALANVVLPALRPAEIFLYARALSAGSVQRPRSAGKLLSQWAVQAERADELRKRVEARQGQPLAELPARILLAQVGLAGKNAKLAEANLDWLGQRMQKDTLQNTAELTCHVAVPALYASDTMKTALPVLEKAIKNLSGHNSEEPVGSVMLAVARFHFDHNDFDAGRKYLQEYKNLLLKAALRSGGDGRINQLQRVAAEFVRVGLVNDVLDLFGQYADLMPLMNRYRASINIGNLAAGFVRQYASRPAAERYEQLKAWTLPTTFRRSLRLVSSFAPNDALPEVFVQVPKNSPDLVTTADLLIDAARQAGKLDELAAEVKKLADQKVESAQTLSFLIEIASGRSATIEPQIKLHVDDYIKNLPKQGDQSKTLQWSDFLLARACLTDEKLRTDGQRFSQNLITHAQRTQNWPFLSHGRFMLNAGLVKQRTGSISEAARDPGLALWHPTSHYNAVEHATGTTPSWWVAQDGLVSHLCGPDQDFLYFDYPLGGTFEFSVDAFDGGWAESHMSYGGMVFEPTTFAGSSVWRVGRHGSITRPSKFTRRDAFNKLTVQVSPGKVGYLVNGHLVFEDKDPSPTSPWLALYTSANRQSVWSNLAIKGSPEIPREVRLTHEDRFEGWISSFYAESQFAHRRKIEAVDKTNPDDAQPPPEKQNPDDFDWSGQNGMIQGRRSESTPQPDAIQSRLYYHRPLRNGESISYEFFHEPEAVMVYPALGRLAFVVEGDKVRVHWMTDGPDSEWTGLKTDNVADEPPYRRGTVTLKSGEWNQAKLSLDKDTAKLEINGTVVYERPLEAHNDRLFGFFHYKDRTSVQVRNVVLRGNWPEKLDAKQIAPVVAEKNIPTNVARLRSELIGERFYGLNVDQFLANARTQPAAERFSTLLAWVLPSETHNTYRLFSTFTPTDAAPAVRELPELNAKRVHEGGTLQSPLFDLIATGKELGKLDELAERVQKFKTPFEHQRRCQLCLLACIRIAQDRDEPAAEALKQLLPLLAKVTQTQPQRERWPEVLATTAAINKPALQKPALALLDFIVKEQFNKSGVSHATAFGAPLERQVRNLHARTTQLALPEKERVVFGADPRAANWSPVTLGRADTRGPGDPIPHWTLKNGALLHSPGHANDFMYFNVPLRGNFEVNCDLTGFGWREAQLAYGGLRVGLIYDLKRYQLAAYNRNLREVNLNPPLATINRDWYAYRLEVKDGNYRAYIDNRLIHEERLPMDSDPWLAIHSLSHLSGGIRNVKITGTPTIPDSLALSNLADLSGWLAGYFGETIEWSSSGEVRRGGGEVTNNAAWYKNGDEITGRKYPSLAGSKQESILQYNRPMLEDGEIEYEFFYEPDKAMTHPALDRLTFLLNPDGVKIHWLTDGMYERNGLTPDNVAIEEASRRGPAKLPLKSPGWNHMTFTLKGDTVTLLLNETAIYERKLENTNQRMFGLFHFADETEVRVRNVKYRGNWPKQLPDAAKLMAPVE